MSNLNKSKTVNFADVAHGTLIFDKANSWDALILKLVDTAWVQRLRRISQTGNTKLVYMFAEHSRFGHSLGVAYLMKI
jgi:HD superfamily phosphohydrolase